MVSYFFHITVYTINMHIHQWCAGQYFFNQRVLLFWNVSTRPSPLYSKGAETDQDHKSPKISWLDWLQSKVTETGASQPDTNLKHITRAGKKYCMIWQVFLWLMLGRWNQSDRYSQARTWSDGWLWLQIFVMKVFFQTFALLWTDGIWTLCVFVQALQTQSRTPQPGKRVSMQGRSRCASMDEVLSSRYIRVRESHRETGCRS